MLLVSEAIARQAQENPERVAYWYHQQETTYEAFNQQVNQFAHRLVQSGLQQGDRVALLLGNSPNFLIAYHGTLRAGMVVVPINPIYTAKEILYILNNSEAKAVVSVGSLSKLFQSLKGDLPSIRHYIYVGDFDGDGYAFSSWMEQGDSAFAGPPLAEEDIACILYTSGTTGSPKGAMLSQKNIASNANSIVKLTHMTSDDRVVAVLPMFHVFCMTVCMNAPLYAGATILVIPKFSPTEVIEGIREQKGTFFAGVPTMYNFIYQTPDATAADLASLRICVSGGASLPVALLHAFELKYRVKILEGYGLSEASPATAFNPYDGIRKPGSIGTNLPDVINMVVDPEGNEVPRGEIGELIVKGPNVMVGYLNMPEETVMTIKDGWLYTGDMARMDEEGYIYIVDRKKDMIIVGGYNVYPREVEEVLFSHPDIVEAAVIGIPDEDYGEAVKAYVVTKNPDLSVKQVIDFCSKDLAKYKVPITVEFISELPKNSTGKILRRQLKQSS